MEASEFRTQISDQKNVLRSLTDLQYVILTFIYISTPGIRGFPVLFTVIQS